MSEQFNFEGVIAELTAILKADENNLEALLNRGNTYYRSEKIKEAIEDYRSLLEKSPSNCGALLGLGNCSYSVGNYIAAAFYFIEALCSIPDREDKPFVNHITFSLAESLFKSNSYELALLYYTKLRNVLSDVDEKQEGLVARIHNDIMVAYSRLRRYTEAVQYFDTIEEKHKSNSDLLVNYGIMLTSIGKNEEAIEAFDKANFLNPDSPIIYVNMAIPYMNRGSEHKCQEDLDKAKEYFNMAIKLSEVDKQKYSSLVKFANTFLEKMNKEGK